MSMDKTVQIWNIEKLECIKSFESEGDKLLTLKNILFIYNKIMISRMEEGNFSVLKPCNGIKRLTILSDDSLLIFDNNIIDIFDSETFTQNNSYYFRNKIEFVTYLDNKIIITFENKNLMIMF